MIPFIKSTQNRFGMSIIYNIISVRSTEKNLEKIKNAKVPLSKLSFLILLAGGCIFTIIFLWYKTPKIEDVIDEEDKDVIDIYEQNFDEQLEIGNSLINQLNDPFIKENKKLLKEISNELIGALNKVEEMLGHFDEKMKQISPNAMEDKSVLEKAKKIRNKVADFQRKCKRSHETKLI